MTCPTLCNIAHNIYFADDVTLFLAYKSEDTLASRANMQSDLDACQTWGRNNGGEFSGSKTSVMCQRAINDTPTAGIQYQMYNEPLTVVSELQHLGITLTDNLDFRKHVASITSKFRYRVHLLSIMSQQLTPVQRVRKTCDRIYLYGVVVWI